MIAVRGYAGAWKCVKRREGATKGRNMKENDEDDAPWCLTVYLCAHTKAVTLEIFRLSNSVQECFEQWSQYD